MTKAAARHGRGERGKRPKVKYCLNNRRVMATRVKERFHRVRWGVGNGREIIKLHSGRQYNTPTFIPSLLLLFRRFSEKTMRAIRFRSNCAKTRVDEDAPGNVLYRRNVVNSTLPVDFIIKSVWLPTSHNVKDKNTGGVFIYLFIFSMGKESAIIFQRLR